MDGEKGGLGGNG